MQGTSRPRFVGVALLVCSLGAATIVQPSAGQELSCRVQLNRSQLSGSQYSFLDNLERKIREYMNDRNWTDDQFLPHEKIACSMQIVVLEALSLTKFRARLIVTTRRPIHSTSQSTVVARINDPEWQFEYRRGSSLTHDLERYDPLTSVLDFYAYVILGYDYDTFSELGGTQHFETARRVADEANSSGDPGWSAVSNQRNRRQLINDLLTQRHRALRKAYYQYHLNGLDRFVEEPEVARKKVLGVLETLQSFNQSVSNSYPLNLFFSTKYKELTAIFSDGGLGNRAYNLLTETDPSHSTEYDKLVQ